MIPQGQFILDSESEAGSQRSSPCFILVEEVRTNRVVSTVILSVFPEFGTTAFLMFPGPHLTPIIEKGKTTFSSHRFDRLKRRLNDPSLERMSLKFKQLF